jgi:hypothetical protein
MVAPRPCHKFQALLLRGFGVKFGCGLMAIVRQMLVGVVHWSFDGFRLSECDTPEELIAVLRSPSCAMMGTVVPSRRGFSSYINSEVLGETASLRA